MYQLLAENYTIGFNEVFMYFIYLLSIFLGIYIIVCKNPVISVLFLIGLFCSIALYLIMIGLYFIGLSYLLVYVGAISILFLFILMLINIRISELITDNNNSVALAVIAVMSFNYSVTRALPLNTSYGYDIETYMLYIYDYIFKNNSIKSNYSIDVTSFSLNDPSGYKLIYMDNKGWESLLVTNTHISSIGNILYTNIFVYFIMISLILLLAMLGAIIITISNQSNVKNKAY